MSPIVLSSQIVIVIHKQLTIIGLFTFFTFKNSCVFRIIIQKSNNHGLFWACLVGIEIMQKAAFAPDYEANSFSNLFRIICQNSLSSHMVSQNSFSCFFWRLCMSNVGAPICPHLVYYNEIKIIIRI